ncbi:unnamed protein product, partial [Ectocarpus sp. 4 AP-2014]
MQKKSQPHGASHPVWKQGHYQVYVPAKYKGVAVCALCVEDKRLERAEVAFKGGSPTNLCNHLKTQLPRHKEAWSRVEKALAAKGTGGGGGSGRQQSITKFA